MRNDADKRERTAELETMARYQDREHKGNAEAAKLRVRVAQHYPTLDLDQHVTTWSETEAGLALVVDGGSTMFRLDGDNLHVVEPTTPGRVVCRIVRPDGSYEDREFKDPFGARAANAKLN